MLSEITRLLETEKFCFLATSYQDDPHVCMMNFTYIAEEDVIILSSRNNTKKVQYIEKNPSVALLLYSLGNNGLPPISCTLFGTAVMISPEKDSIYRERHYKKHDDMGKFILGENISVILIRIKSAAVSDDEDNVHNWVPDK